MKQIRIQDIQLPCCAVGTWGWGGGLNGSRTVFGSTPSEEELQKCYRSALDGGLTLFDTAAVYGWGTSEKLLGSFSENEEILISTKYTPLQIQRTGMEKSLKKSLKRLHKDCADIFWIHNTLRLEKNVRTALTLLKQGIV